MSAWLDHAWKQALRAVEFVPTSPEHAEHFAIERDRVANGKVLDRGRRGYDPFGASGRRIAIAEAITLPQVTMALASAWTCGRNVIDATTLAMPA